MQRWSDMIRYKDVRYEYKRTKICIWIIKKKYFDSIATWPKLVLLIQHSPFIKRWKQWRYIEVVEWTHCLIRGMGLVVLLIIFFYPGLTSPNIKMSFYRLSRCLGALRYGFRVSYRTAIWHKLLCIYITLNMHILFVPLFPFSFESFNLDKS